MPPGNYNHTKVHTLLNGVKLARQGLSHSYYYCTCRRTTGNTGERVSRTTWQLRLSHLSRLFPDGKRINTVGEADYSEDKGDHSHWEQEEFSFFYAAENISKITKVENVHQKKTFSSVTTETGIYAKCVEQAIVNDVERLVTNGHFKNKLLIRNVLLASSQERKSFNPNRPKQPHYNRSGPLHYHHTKTGRNWTFCSYNGWIQSRYCLCILCFHDAVFPLLLHE